MNITQLVEEVRQLVFIDPGGTAFPDFNDARIRSELNTALRAAFARAITQARQGYWLKQYYAAVAPFAAKVQIPYRAVSGGLEQVAISDGGKYVKLEEVTETHAQDYETAPGTYGSVKKYCIRGDQVVLLPAPASAYTLRLTYYVRPSQLMEAQAPGQITAFDPVLRTITMAAYPVNKLTGASIAVGDPIDIVHVGGWNELALVDATITASAFPTITVGGSNPLDEVRVGDFVRYGDQTDWPCLPEDHHRTLAEVAAVAVCKQLALYSKADSIAQAAEGDFQRFADLLVSRVKAEAPVLRAPLSVLQIGRGRRGFFGWR